MNEMVLKEKRISLLLSSGFSVPAGIPSVKCLNSYLKKISRKKDEVNHLNISSKNEERFSQKFLEFYNEKLQKENKKFHYEEFYDYYQSLFEKEINNMPQKEKCEKYNDFRKFCKDNDFRREDCNLSHFHDTFSQLLASLLRKDFSKYWFQKKLGKLIDTHYPLPYSEFLDFLKFAKESCMAIHIHSLNHDLLMEYLVKYIPTEIVSDGFSYVDSPYYSECIAGNMVKLKNFVNKFPGPICFYKLHGSIDYYLVEENNGIYETIKIPYGLSAKELHVEKINENGEKDLVSQYEPNLFPDFLTGENTKIIHYQERHYNYIFEHFKKNLEQSQKLLIIGYGFGDKGINKYLEKFLQNNNKQTLVIDVNEEKIKGKIINRFGSNHNIEFLCNQKGIAEINKDDLIAWVNK